MNPGLVICLFASSLVGMFIAALSLAAGWGIIVAVMLWSSGGSVALIISTLLAFPGEERPRRAAAPLPAGLASRAPKPVNA